MSINEYSKSLLLENIKSISEKFCGNEIPNDNKYEKRPTRRIVMKIFVKNLIFSNRIKS